MSVGLRMAKTGDIVICVHAPDYLEREISTRVQYVVNSVMTVSETGAIYYKILGNDNHGHWLLSSLFADT